MSTEAQAQEQVADALGSLSSTIVTLRAELKDAQAERDAAVKTAVALKKAAASSSSECWTIPKGVVVIESEATRTSRAAGFGPVTLFRSHVASLALVGGTVPFDASGELSASLDELVYAITTTGGARHWACLDEDDAAALIHWAASAPGTKKEGK
jgi:hypothetical protein